MMGSLVVPTGTTGPVPIIRVPAGLCNITFWNNSLTGTVYVGSSTTVTSANGLVCHSIPTSFFNYVYSAGVQLYGTAATAAGTISYIIVTDQA